MSENGHIGGNGTEERMHGDVLEHKHMQGGYDYWHPANRVHKSDEPGEKVELPVGHVLEGNSVVLELPQTKEKEKYVVSKKPQVPLKEKLFLGLVEVTPIQMMEIGASLEIGAVQSLMEGLNCRRYAGSCLLSEHVNFPVSDRYGGGAIFYAEWQPNHNDITHRYLIAVAGENVYVGYFPHDGRRPRLYGIHHKKMEVIKFLHKTNKISLEVPELTLLTDWNIPNILLRMDDERGSVLVFHKQGQFYTHSVYGEFVPLEYSTAIPDVWKIEDSVERGKYYAPDGINTVGYYKADSTGKNMNDKDHPWYMFQGATGFVQLHEGKMFIYPDGSIRFLTSEDEQTVFRDFTDLTMVQGDLVAYEGLTGTPFMEFGGTNEASLDRHNVKAEIETAIVHDGRGKVYVREDCILTISHPEHDEVKYEACKGEILALLPGTSRPFAKNGGRD